MRIPVDGSSGIQADPYQRKQIAPANQQTADALGGLGRTMAGIGNDMADEQIRQKQASDRLAAANHLLDYEVSARRVRSSIIDRLASGELDSEEAADLAYAEEMGAIDGELELPKIGQQTVADLQHSIRRVRTGIDADFTAALNKSRIDRAEAGLISFMDGAGKMVADPSVNLDALDAQIEAAGAQAIEAKVPRDRVAALVQGAKDANWTNSVTERVIRGKDSMAELKAIERDLTAEDGRYFQKLDTEKRNALLARVLSAQDRLTAKQQAAEAKRDKGAERALREYQQVIASGFPVNDRLRTDVARLTAGTSLEGDFVAAQLEERAVSDFLRRPVAEQRAFLVEKERQLRTGGISDTREIGLYNSMSKAFGNNISALGERPIEMHETRTGSAVPALDAALLTTPQGIDTAIEIMRDRVTTLDALEAQFGTVGKAPLKQSEAEQFGAILKQQTPTKRAEMLGLFARGFSDPEVFRGAVKQMLGDDPRAYAAGLAHGMGFRTTEGRRLGEMIEQGSAILKDKSVIKAKSNGSDGTRELFNQVIDANTIPVGSPDREMYYQSALAIYAKLAAEEGKLGYDLQDKLFRRSLNLATGGLIELRGQQFVAPRWGMSEEEFTDSINAQLKSAAAANGIDYGDLTEMSLIPDDKVAGRYYLKQDAIHFQAGRDGRPLFIEVR